MSGHTQLPHGRMCVHCQAPAPLTSAPQPWCHADVLEDEGVESLPPYEPSFDMTTSSVDRRVSFTLARNLTTT